jgi:hypothetical protein
MKFWPIFFLFSSDLDKICAGKNVYLVTMGFTKIGLVNGMI